MRMFVFRLVRMSLQGIRMSGLAVVGWVGALCCEATPLGQVVDFDPVLMPSPLEARIRLAEKRLNAYPADELDFIMIDLEHPTNRIRHAHQCTSDMTGRTIEFFGEARQILPDLDRAPADRLYRRIRAARRDLPAAFARRFFPYYRLTHDPDVLAFIRKTYEGIGVYLKNPDACHHYHSHTCDSLIEGMADLYEIDGDPKLVEMAKASFDGSLKAAGAHSHGRMTILRAALKMGRVSGDAWFLDKVRPEREKILSQEYADGSVSEALPRSHRTEGCSIGDWVMLNLRYWDLTGDVGALETAEHTLVNALWFNQFVTGGFGHRDYRGCGYDSEVEEAWWCCTQTGGMALCEFARHAVQLVDGRIVVNYLVPGTYALRRKDGRAVCVTIDSGWPARHRATVRISGWPDADVTIRTPSYVKNVRNGRNRDVLTVSGDMGHYAERRDGGWTLNYGPFVLAPMVYSWSALGEVSGDIPKGYVPPRVDGSSLSLVEPDAKDANGFWPVTAGIKRVPMWPAFDDGAGSRTGTEFRAPAVVSVRDGSGHDRELYFHPLCYQTSNLTLRYVPMTFGLIGRKK